MTNDELIALARAAAAAWRRWTIALLLALLFGLGLALAAALAR